MAGTVIDALVVELRLDPTTFKRGGKAVDETLKGARDSADSTAKVMEARGKQAAAFFSQIKTEALGLVGVLLGGRGLEQFVREATTSMAALGREAQNTGLSVRDLAAMRMVMERNGASADEAAASMANLREQVEQYKLGLGGVEAVQTLQTIGAGINDDQLTIMKKFAAYTEAHKDDVALTNVIGKRLHYGQGTINDLRKGAGTFDAELAESLKLGVPNEEMIRRATKLQHDFKALEEAAEGLGNVLLTDLQPALSVILEGFTELMKGARRLAEEYPGVTTVMVDFVAALISLKFVLLAIRIAAAAADLAKFAAGMRAVVAAQAVASAGAGAGAAAGAGAGAAGGGAAAAGAGAAAGGAGSLLLRALPFLGGVGGFLYGMRPTALNEDNPHAVMTPGMVPPGGGAGAANPNDPRGIRNNNPLNLSYVPGQGATGSDGRFGTYGSMEQGIAAAQRQLLRYQDVFGLNTVRGIVSRWAPPSENDTASYIAGVAAAMGVGPDAPLDLRNQATASSLVSAMIRREEGRSIDPGTVGRGVAMGGAGPASRLPPAPSLGPAARLSAGAQGAGGRGATVNVGGVTVGDVHTQAKDARGVARDLGHEINEALVTQANRGLS